LLLPDAGTSHVINLLFLPFTITCLFMWHVEASGRTWHVEPLDFGLRPKILLIP
jgi:hypothetical protein